MIRNKIGIYIIHVAHFYMDILKSALQWRTTIGEGLRKNPSVGVYD